MINIKRINELLDDKEFIKLNNELCTANQIKVFKKLDAFCIQRLRTKIRTNYFIPCYNMEERMVVVKFMYELGKTLEYLDGLITDDTIRKLKDLIENNIDIKDIKPLYKGFNKAYLNMLNLSETL